MNNQSLKLISAGIVAIIGLVVFVVVTSRAPTGEWDTFTQCLAQKNVTMYGAAWCTHCQSQKKLFGNSFSRVPYVECPENTQECIDKKITGFPTWILSDGTHLDGEQTLETLAQKSDCPLVKDTLPAQ